MTRRFWLLHAALPAALFALALLAVSALRLDFATLDRLFDPLAGAFTARDSFWTEEVMHQGGNQLVTATAVAALLVFAAGFARASLRAYRRGAAYVFLCLALAPALVAGIKQVSNIDCPWDLTRYGGDRPYVRLLEDRPDALPRAHCWPGAHSSGGFAFFAFYFLWRDRRPRRARGALIAALLLGTGFALTQWLRGAHFPSHDLWSAALCWGLCLALYAGWYVDAISANERVTAGTPGGTRGPIIPPAAPPPR